MQNGWLQRKILTEFNNCVINRTSCPSLRFWSPPSHFLSLVFYSCLGMFKESVVLVFSLVVGNALIPPSCSNGTANQMAHSFHICWGVVLFFQRLLLPNTAKCLAVSPTVLVLVGPSQWWLSMLMMHDAWCSHWILSERESSLVVFSAK